MKSCALFLRLILPHGEQHETWTGIPDNAEWFSPDDVQRR